MRTVIVLGPRKTVCVVTKTSFSRLRFSREKNVRREFHLSQNFLIYHALVDETYLDSYLARTRSIE